ncbi:hypothetical protein STENM36S_03306 [Streptomyces tendae]
MKKLAAGVEKAQDPEIRTLSGWLASWGEDVPAEGAMDHSTHDMGGMMTGEEMTELENSSGKAFDTAFTQMMIKHHEGAVEMARTEQADGAYGPAKKIAGEIIDSQSAEIEQMNELLGKGYRTRPVRGGHRARPPRTSQCPAHRETRVSLRRPAESCSCGPRQAWSRY